ncbi:hypothetical protein [Pseudoduganella chitinolytica]|uniref:GspL cytoplasmic actin-ATPase-like domain-containing protein n=1 Tax=Pseudoduganella chitinolytica TaxID=34070 RepID=A0ABY8BGJ2_9BURK|nr:hypothetical protein [Pseudoduganella chitinolytica]WEF34796.1 hypothetical protein PX653_08555 [Pseudoduganella chitinolytica]
MDEFIAYLERQGAGPAWLVVDLIEEDFSRHALPHVRGRAGRQLRARRLGQQYRDTPYRTALVQGRLEEGRRDDVVLFTALTNPALLAPWIEAMELMQTPLAGIYSATLLSAALLRRMTRQERPAAAPPRHELLVTLQSGGMRQTYLQDGALKFSRLVQPTPDGDVADTILPETRRTQQFLASVRLLERDEALQVTVLAPAAAVEELAQRCEDGPATRYEVVPLDTAARALGMAATPVLADELLLTIVARHAPASHYPLAGKDGYYRLWRLRLSLFASSAVLGTACLAWTVANLVGYGISHGNANGLRSETAHYQAAYRNSMSSMPPAVDKTVNMKAAVQIDRMVAQQGPSPQHMLGMVSEALENSPQIRLTQLEWRAQVPGQAAVAAPGAAPGSPALVAPTSSLALGIPKAPAQTLRLHAEVLAGQDNYRVVLDSMNGFARQLARMPHMTVEIAQLPFDIRSNVKLSGSVGVANSGEDRAKFTLDLVWTP